ncbi:imidazole glycerol phosphate synthase subunit hisH [Leifsonia sp. 98AMF]|uniref:imidazole glycerol phosphate synthase subunit HisH n=1 Tax=unclassified Leifsonia TaxID=2663824 RepID=UPI00087C4B8C|nr:MULTISPECIES: imidazole glycerol phosphate synthase subunit HisH [unclassified Leifsonia]SDH44544.1 imidazole glycerol phosphate synthase subunit hisH [Leifsonia sp. 197AMF]SDI92673.1 imidazole glycerol phosphate synthase subunit hisH [Leifsonia sp. 466MF]SDJ86159.1 imidazole glycerol phosphate synthase subunit hisH [Leifsonia sp. 157MF]SDN96406.1 imidazole glycerol phosphate synthase subunit hisH [Leifsonia sp. 509MF]SEN08961.1 imidazole glycerol phosphate synthase subunit hisH [Leifsonia 
MTVARTPGSAPQVVVFDYGTGNVHSAVKALEAAGAEVELTGDRKRALEADGLLVPGVGAFTAVAEALKASHGDEVVDRRLAGGRPVLGICVGMQVMFERGVENGVETEGLGEWPGTVDLIRADVVPHMGWNTVRAPEDSTLFAGLRDERFYFVHSYAAQDWTLEASGPFAQPKVTWADHGSPFVAAVENGPLSATQFHPEKSGRAGIQLLRNWIGTL